MEDYTFHFVRLVTEIHDHFKERNITLEIRTDFKALKKERKRAGQCPPSPPFDVARDELLPDLSFWVAGRTPSGKLVITQAVRLHDLGRTSLADFCRNHVPRVFGDGKMGKKSAPPAHKIKGRVAYHGEGWAHPKYRGARLNEALGVLCQAVALVKWKPDYIFGVCAPPLQKTGFQLRLGYVHNCANAIDWKVVPTGANGETWLVWNTREDMERLVRQPLSVYL